MKTSKQSLISPLAIISMLILVITVGAPWMTSLNYVDMVDYKAYIASAFLSISMLFYWLFNHHENELVINKTQLYLLIFFILSTLSILWSDDYQLFAAKFFLYLFGFLSFYLTLRINYCNNNYLRLAIAIAIASAIVSTIGILQYLFEFPSKITLPYENIPASTFGNKNAANQIIPFTFPIIIFLLISRISRIQFFVASWALVSTITYVYYAETKAVWLGLLVEFLLLAIYYVYIRKSVSFNFVKFHKVAFLMGFILLFSSLDYISTKHTSDTSSKANSVVSTLVDRYSSSSSGRKLIWKSAIGIANQSPIMGTGLGSFPYQLSVEGFHGKLRKAHNDILEMYVELGLVGVSIFTLFCFYLFKDFALINKKSSKSEAIFFNILMVALSGSFINLLFSWPYQTTHGVVFFSIFIALIIQKSKTYDQKVFTIYIPSWTVLISKFLVIVVLLSSFYTYRLWTHSVSEFYTYSGSDGFKFDTIQLRKYAKNLPNRDQHLQIVALKYWWKDYRHRASRVLKIASDFNPNNMMALYRQFVTLIDESKLDEAKVLISIMTDNNKMHPLTFRALLVFYRNKKDMISAKSTYEFYKKHFDSLDTVDYRAYKTLVRWSVTLSDYKNTKRFYDIYLANGPFLDPSVENSMANFYVYNQQYEKAVKHINYALKIKPWIVRQDVLDALKSRGLITK